MNSLRRWRARVIAAAAMFGGVVGPAAAQKPAPIVPAQPHPARAPDRIFALPQINGSPHLQPVSVANPYAAPVVGPFGMPVASPFANAYASPAGPGNLANRNNLAVFNPALFNQFILNRAAAAPNAHNPMGFNPAFNPWTLNPGLVPIVPAGGNNPFLPVAGGQIGQFIARGSDFMFLQVARASYLVPAASSPSSTASDATPSRAVEWSSFSPEGGGVRPGMSGFLPWMW